MESNAHPLMQSPSKHERGDTPQLPHPGLTGRSHRAFVCIAALGCLLLAAPPTRAATVCQGDCGRDGEVTVNELVTMVNVSLEVAEVNTCVVGDVNGDGGIAVNEIVGAVDMSLDGCPAIAGAEIASAAIAVARTLTYMPTLPLAVSAALSGVNTPSNCPAGGSYTNSCEDRGTGSVRVPITVSDCRLFNLDGALALDGAITVTGTGQCPNVLLPNNVTFGYAMDGTIEAGLTDRTPRLHTRYDLGILLEAFALGDPPCRVRGGSLLFDGPVQYRTGNTDALDVTYDRTAAAVVFDEFHVEPTCDPGIMTLTVGGPARIADRYGEPEVRVDAAFRPGFSAEVQRGAEPQVQLNGRLDAEAFGGVVSMATPASLALTLGEPCFHAGVLDVMSPRLTTRLTFDADGSVAIDDGADGTVETTLPSCTTRPDAAGQ